MPPTAPSDPGALTRAGLDHLRAARFEQARQTFERILQLAPDDVNARVSLAESLDRLDRVDDAIPHLRRALELAPQRSDARVGLAISLRRTGNPQEAIAILDAVAGASDDPELLNIRANLLADLRREDEALALFDQLLRRNSNDAKAHIGRARVLLTVGRLAEGFREWEWRFLATVGAPPIRTHPMWDGSADPAGRTIAVRAEQGLGDTIQFLRYVPLLAARGAKVIVQCQPTLIDLITPLKGAAMVRSWDAPSPPFDWWVPAMSLPRCFGTTLETIPVDVPYLHAPPANAARFADLSSHDATSPRPLRVGLAWFGQPAQLNNRNRSVPPEYLAPLAELARAGDGGKPAIALYSLQKPPAPPLPDALNDVVVDLAPRLTTMSDAAGAMTQLDLILTVDSALAHLAGAMGRPVWTMLAYAPDWRYLTDRTDSPWYPTMRLFRPPAPRAWDAVVGDVVAALKQFTTA